MIQTNLVLTSFLAMCLVVYAHLFSSLIRCCDENDTPSSLASLSSDILKNPFRSMGEAYPKNVILSK